MSVDPAFRTYSGLSPYSFADNSPVRYKDADGNLIVDKNGNIVFVQIATYKMRHGSDPDKEVNAVIGYVFANDGTKIMVYRNMDTKEKGYDTDCHGVSFTNGKYWIDNGQVPALLKGDKYSEQNYEDRRKGDIIVYTNSSDDVEDSRTLTKDKNKVFGQGGVEEKNTETDINNTWTSPDEEIKARVFRKTSKNVVYSSAEIEKLKNQTLHAEEKNDLVREASVDSDRFTAKSRKAYLPANSEKKVSIIPKKEPKK